MNLKQIREYLGITQGELSQKTGINIPTLSNYESGNTPIMLEDCIIIEKQLSTRLDWDEPLTLKQKHEIVQNLIYLAENYPLNAVLNFAPRAFKEGQRIGDAGQFIKHYATISGVNDEPHKNIQKSKTMYTIRKEFHFSASHQLLGLPETHPCSRIHGHNYIVTVELSTAKLNDVGFVVDYRALEPIKKYIDGELDHMHLNVVLPFNPTAENMAKHIYHLFKAQFPKLTAIEVSETPKTNARYTPEYDE